MSRSQRLLHGHRAHRRTDTEHPINPLRPRSSTEPTDQIIEALRPVDWVSVQAVASVSGLSKRAVSHRLAQLEHAGVVEIGQKRIPPETKTVAWLTDDERQIRRWQ